MPSEEALLADLGTPEEVACVLLDAVGTKEHTHFNSVRLRWFRCAIVVLTVLVVIAVGAIVHSYSTELKRVEITIVEDDVPSQYSINIDDK